MLPKKKTKNDHAQTSSSPVSAREQKSDQFSTFRLQMGGGGLFSHHSPPKDSTHDRKKTEGRMNETVADDRKTVKRIQSPPSTREWRSAAWCAVCRTSRKPASPADWNCAGKRTITYIKFKIFKINPKNGPFLDRRIFFNFKIFYDFLHFLQFF